MAHAIDSLKRLIAAVLLAAWSVSPAGAATVANQGGEVMVNKGQGFQPVASFAELAPGGQVLVRPGGVATIAYVGGCRVRVGSGVWLVQEKAPCPTGTTEINFTQRMNQQGPPGPPPPGDDIDPLLVGGLAVGGGLVIACVVSWCRSDGGRPASP
jgi:hypothetical protein